MRQKIGKMSGYTHVLLAGAALMVAVAGASKTYAGVVYTAVGASITPGPGGGGGSVQLNLPTDAIALTQSALEIYGDSIGGGREVQLLVGGLGATTFSDTTVGAGTVIGPAVSFSSDPSAVLFGLVSDGTESGSLTVGATSYVGIRFTYESAFYYGYASVLLNTAESDTSTASLNATVIGYAFETLANTPILAGALPPTTAAVPTPTAATGGLALLGIMTLRRRR